MYSTTKTTLSLPHACTSTNYQVIATICKNRTKNTIEATGTINLGTFTPTTFYIASKGSNSTYGDACCIIIIGY